MEREACSAYFVQSKHPGKVCEHYPLMNFCETSTNVMHTRFSTCIRENKYSGTSFEDYIPLHKDHLF